MDQKNLKVTWATTGVLGSAMHLAKKTNNSLRCGSNSSRLLELLNVSDGGGSFGKTDYYSYISIDYCENSQNKHHPIPFQFLPDLCGSIKPQHLATFIVKISFSYRW